MRSGPRPRRPARGHPHGPAASSLSGLARWAAVPRRDHPRLPAGPGLALLGPGPRPSAKPAGNPNNQPKKRKPREGRAAGLPASEGRGANRLHHGPASFSNQTPLATPGRGDPPGGPAGRLPAAGATGQAPSGGRLRPPPGRPRNPGGPHGDGERMSRRPRQPGPRGLGAGVPVPRRRPPPRPPRAPERPPRPVLALKPTSAEPQRARGGRRGGRGEEPTCR